MKMTTTNNNNLGDLCAQSEREMEAVHKIQKIFKLTRNKSKRDPNNVCTQFVGVEREGEHRTLVLDNQIPFYESGLARRGSTGDLNEIQEVPENSTSGETNTLHPILTDSDPISNRVLKKASKIAFAEAREEDKKGENKKQDKSFNALRCCFGGMYDDVRDTMRNFNEKVVPNAEKAAENIADINVKDGNDVIGSMKVIMDKLKTSFPRLIDATEDKLPQAMKDVGYLRAFVGQISKLIKMLLKGSLPGWLIGLAEEGKFTLAIIGTILGIGGVFWWYKGMEHARLIEKIVVIVIIMWAPLLGSKLWDLIQWIWKNAKELFGKYVQKNLDKEIGDCCKHGMAGESEGDYFKKFSEWLNMSWADMMVPLLSVIGVVTSLIVWGKMPDAKESKNWGDTFRSVGEKGRSFTNIVNGFNSIQNFCTDVSKKIVEWCSKREGAKNLKQDKAVTLAVKFDIENWVAEVKEMALLENRFTGFGGHEHMKKVRTLYDRGQAIEQYLIKNTVPTGLSVILRDAIKMATELVNESHTFKGMTGFRLDPFFLCLVGAPGVGKSAIVHKMINDLLDANGENKVDRLYTRCCADAYWSNYHNQTAVYFDDLGAILQRNTQSDIGQIMGCKSNNPYSVPMAAVDEKGRYFTSKYIFACTNHESLDNNTDITTPDAYYRRRNLLVKVSRLRDVPMNAADPSQGLVFSVMDTFIPNQLRRIWREPWYFFEEEMTVEDMPYDLFLNFCTEYTQKYLANQEKLIATVQGLPERDLASEPGSPSSSSSANTSTFGCIWEPDRGWVHQDLPNWTDATREMDGGEGVDGEITTEAIEFDFSELVAKFNERQFSPRVMGNELFETVHWRPEHWRENKKTFTDLAAGLCDCEADHELGCNYHILQDMILSSMNLCNFDQPFWKRVQLIKPEANWNKSRYRLIGRDWDSLWDGLTPLHVFSSMLMHANNDARIAGERLCPRRIMLRGPVDCIAPADEKERIKSSLEAEEWLFRLKVPIAEGENMRFVSWPDVKRFYPSIVERFGFVALVDHEGFIILHPDGATWKDGLDKRDEAWMHLWATGNSFKGIRRLSDWVPRAERNIFIGFLEDLEEKGLQGVCWSEKQKEVMKEALEGIGANNSYVLWLLMTIEHLKGKRDVEKKSVKQKIVDKRDKFLASAAKLKALNKKCVLEASRPIKICLALGAGFVAIGAAIGLFLGMKKMWKMVRKLFGKEKHQVLRNNETNGQEFTLNHVSVDDLPDEGNYPFITEAEFLRQIEEEDWEWIKKSGLLTKQNFHKNWPNSSREMETALNERRHREGKPVWTFVPSEQLPAYKEVEPRKPRKMVKRKGRTPISDEAYAAMMLKEFNKKFSICLGPIEDVKLNPKVDKDDIKKLIDIGEVDEVVDVPELLNRTIAVAEGSVDSDSADQKTRRQEANDHIRYVIPAYRDKKYNAWREGSVASSADESTDRMNDFPKVRYVIPAHRGRQRAGWEKEEPKKKEKGSLWFNPLGAFQRERKIYETKHQLFNNSHVKLEELAIAEMSLSDGLEGVLPGDTFAEIRGWQDYAQKKHGLIKYKPDDNMVIDGDFLVSSEMIIPRGKGNPEKPTGIHFTGSDELAPKMSKVKQKELSYDFTLLCENVVGKGGMSVNAVQEYYSGREVQERDAQAAQLLRTTYLKMSATMYNRTRGQKACVIRCVGSWVLCPAHYVGEFRETDEVYLICHAKCARIKPLGKNAMLVNNLQDLVVWDLGREVPSSPDYTVHFPGVDDWKRFTPGHGVLSVTMYDKNCAHQYVAEIKKLEPVKADVSAPTGFFETYGKREHTVVAGLRYGVNTCPGYCGALIVRCDPKMQAKVCALHVAGNNVYAVGYGEMIVRENIQNAIAYMMYATPGRNLRDESAIDGSGLEDPLVSTCSCEMDNPYFIPGNLSIMGKMTNVKEIPTSADKTTIVKSPIHGLIGKPETEPSILHTNDRRLGELKGKFDPKLDSVGKYGHSCAPFHPDEVKTVEDHLIRTFAGLENSLMERQVRNLDVGINGIEGTDYWRPINMRSSAGYPYVLRKPTGGEGKEWLFKELEPGQSGCRRYEVADEFLKQEMEITEHLCRENKYPMYLTVECLKDERRKLKKIYDQPSTRTFTMLPVGMNILFRRYFMDFAAMIMCNRTVSFTQVGINASSMEWSELMHRLKRKGQFGFAGDYAKFDGIGPPAIYESIVHVINHWYNDGAENARIRKVLVHAIVHRNGIVGDKVLRYSQGMPSGFPMTVIFNSLVNYYFLGMAWSHLVSVSPLRMECSLASFDKFCAVLTYGDDNVVAVSDKFLEYYNLRTVAMFLSAHNITYTDDQKNPIHLCEPYVNLESVTFLKRSFKKLNSSGLFWMAALDKVSIEEQVHWLRQSPDNHGALYSNIDNALYEASVHGEEYFDDLQMRISHAYERIVVPYEFRSYSDMRRRWWESVLAGQMAETGLNKIIEQEPTKTGVDLQYKYSSLHSGQDEELYAMLQLAQDFRVVSLDI